MTWNVEYDDRAKQELRRLDRAAQKRLLSFFRQRIAVEGIAVGFIKRLMPRFIAKRIDSRRVNAANPHHKMSVEEF